MEDMTGNNSGKQPPKKKLPLSLTRKKSRFATPVSEEEFCDAANGVVPLNTKKNNCWAQRMLNAWIEERNKVSHVHDSRLARVRAPLPYYNGPTVFRYNGRATTVPYMEFVARAVPLML